MLLTPCSAGQSCPMRILAVIPQGPTPSAMVFADRLADAIAETGHGVRVFRLRTRTSISGLIAEGFRFRKAIHDFDPHVIHAHYGTVTSLFTCLLSQGRPCFITFRGSDLNGSPGNSTLRNFAGRLASLLSAFVSDGVVCVSEGLRRRLGWLGRSAVIAPSGVDVSMFCPMPRLEARTQLGLAHAGKIVLMNGRDSATKGVPLARASIMLAKQVDPSIELLILDGSTNPQLMPLYLNAADCLLVTSQTEGSPTIVQEALACRLPIVSVQVGDVRERIRDVDHCTIVARDPSIIAEAVSGACQSLVRSSGPGLESIPTTRDAASLHVSLFAEVLRKRRPRPGNLRTDPVTVLPDRQAD